jgi:curved DNA-binding protein CbpA
MRYFKPPFTIENLKSQYKKHAKILHPDKNGNEEDFKKMIQEYNDILEQKKKRPTKKKKKVYTNKKPQTIIFNKYIVFDLHGIYEQLKEIL